MVQVVLDQFVIVHIRVGTDAKRYYQLSSILCVLVEYIFRGLPKLLTGRLDTRQRGAR
jgi:hypothetical protein